MSMIKIRINNWDGLNPRKDVKRSTWFRCEHGLVDDPEFYDFTDSEFKAWIYIMSMASRKSSSEIIVNTLHADRACKISEKSLRSCLKKLSDLEIVNVHVTDAVRGRIPTNVTNVTNVTNETLNNIPTLTPKTLFEFWNENRKVLPACVKLSESRKRRAKAQIKNYPDIKHWEQSLSRRLLSQFCRSEWRPGFDDWLSEGKRIKALEGKYDDRKKSDPKSFSQQREDKARSQFERINKGDL